MEQLDPASPAQRLVERGTGREEARLQFGAEQTVLLIEFQDKKVRRHYWCAGPAALVEPEAPERYRKESARKRQEHACLRQYGLYPEAADNHVMVSGECPCMRCEQRKGLHELGHDEGRDHDASECRKRNGEEQGQAIYLRLRSSEGSNQEAQAVCGCRHCQRNKNKGREIPQPHPKKESTHAKHQCYLNQVHQIVGQQLSDEKSRLWQRCSKDADERPLFLFSNETGCKG